MRNHEKATRNPYPISYFSVFLNPDLLFIFEDVEEELNMTDHFELGSCRVRSITVANQSSCSCASREADDDF